MLFRSSKDRVRGAEVFVGAHEQAARFFFRLGAVRVFADDHELVAGRFTTVDGQPRSNLARLAANGAETVTSDRATPDALRKHLAAEIAKWVPIIQKAGVKAE